ncbi:MAG: TlpA disulfide reductase family protein [Phycisphaerae bacterium]|nr:TlpA disulfide reductase family protein [Phycisphaerae bacterium]
MRILHGLMALVVCAAAVFCSLGAMAETKLKIGATAPPLSISDWINGGSSVVEPDKVYVVVFWATGSGSVPHLNDIQQKYKGRVTLIGVSKEAAKTVKAYVQSKGATMNYLIGVDENGKTSKDWLETEGKAILPTAFIVNRDRKVVWIGHPGEQEFERVIAAVVAGKYDPVAENKARPAVEAARRAAKLRNYREAFAHYETAIGVDPALFSSLALEKYKIMLNDAGDAKGAAAYGRSLLKSYADNGMVLGDLAVMVLTDPAIKEPDTELANLAAKQMLSAAGRSDAAILSRLAAVQFATGLTSESVETQMEAWMMAPEAAKAAYKVKLDQYRNAATKAQTQMKSQAAGSN